MIMIQGQTFKKAKKKASCTYCGIRTNLINHNINKYFCGSTLCFTLNLYESCFRMLNLRLERLLEAFKEIDI